MGCRRLIVLLIILVILAFNSYAQEDVFLEGSVLQYFAPDKMDDLLKSKLGVRFAIGIDSNNFLFAAETGYSNITGESPLIEKITLIPVVAKFGYMYPLQSNYGLQAMLNLGFAMFNIERYETAVNAAIGKSIEESERSLLGGFRLYATMLPRDRIKLYAGGGADIIFEKAGPIAMAVIEAGISIKPFTAKPKKPSEPVERFEIAPEEIVFESRSENIIVEETAQGRSVRLLNAVYFEADTAVMIERYRPILNEAGERLRANPSLRILLRGYAAPFGTAEGLVELSSARARYCAEYLAAHYGISESRIRIEFFGAERAPAFRDATWESYRCVELILE